MDVALFLQPVQLATYSGIAEVGDTAECGNAWKACASIISKSSKSNKDKLGNSIANVRVDDLINKSVCHFTLTSNRHCDGPIHKPPMPLFSSGN